MFSRKYIFESRQTKFKRLIINVFIAGVIAFFCIIFIGFYLPLFSIAENDRTDQAFYKKDPDLIAVFTGDVGRISFALKAAKRYKNSKIFISGVYTSNTIQSLIEQQSLLALQKELLESNKIEIDHFARNTVENVISTLKFLRERKEYKNVVIISNDYHIMRIKMIVDKLVDPKTDKYNIYYKGLVTDYTHGRSIRILYKEVIKSIKTFLFLMLWDKESLNALEIDTH